MWWWRGRRLRARAYTQSTQTDWQTEWQAQQIITSEERASARSYTSTVAVALYATHQPKLRVSRQKHTRKSKSDRGTQFQMFKRQTKTEWSHNCYEMIQYKDVSARTHTHKARQKESIWACAHGKKLINRNRIINCSDRFLLLCLCVWTKPRESCGHTYIFTIHTNTKARSTAASHWLRKSSKDKSDKNHTQTAQSKLHTGADSCRRISIF